MTGNEVSERIGADPPSTLRQAWSGWLVPPMQLPPPQPAERLPVNSVGLSRAQFCRATRRCGAAGTFLSHDRVLGSGGEGLRSGTSAGSVGMVFPAV